MEYLTQDRQGAGHYVVWIAPVYECKHIASLFDLIVGVEFMSREASFCL
jgi:hypothetical protein